MRSSDEQFQEILKRADHLRDTHTDRKSVTIWSLVSAACVVLLVVSACFLPVFQADHEAAVSTQYGSLLLGAPYTGYIVIGVLAFFLGIFVTLLALRIRKMREKERGQS